MSRHNPHDVKDPLLFGLIHDFLKVYLPTQKASSPYTIKAYKKAIDWLLDFVTEQKGIALSAVTFEMIDNKMLAAYLGEIETNGGNIATRNHRLACVRAFYVYLSQR